MPKDPRYPGAQLAYDSLRRIQRKLSEAIGSDEGDNYEALIIEAEEELCNVLDLFAGWCGGHVTLVDLVDQPE